VKSACDVPVNSPLTFPVTSHNLAALPDEKDNRAEIGNRAAI
jgi:hypothetical protein